MFAAYGNTYPVKDTLRSLGGKWDKNNKVWKFEKEPKEQVTGVVFAPSPLPKDWWIYESITSNLDAGHVFLTPLALRDKGTGQYPRKEYKTALIQWEGSTFNDDSERWEKCLCTLARPVTDAEWQQVLDIRAKKQQKHDSYEALSKLFREKGQKPEKVEVIPEGKTLVFPIRSQSHKAILGELAAYWLDWNGASGDDWSYNNYGSYCVWILPRTAEVDAAFEHADQFWKS